MSAKEIVIQLATALFSAFDPVAATELLDPGYIQHNPAVPTGAAAIVGFIPVPQQSGFQAQTHRVIAEGDLVVLHSIFSNASILGAETVVAFDVFRVEDGKVAEHWDNLQPAVPADQTANGNSMVDGATEVVDLEKTAENKALVQGMLSEVFMGGQVDKIADYISTESYTQHNPQIGNGLEGLGAAIAALTEAGQMFTYDEVHMVVRKATLSLRPQKGRWAVCLWRSLICSVWRMARLSSTGMCCRKFLPRWHTRTGSSEVLTSDVVGRPVCLGRPSCD